jgi:hypothetical protein
MDPVQAAGRPGSGLVEMHRWGLFEQVGHHLGKASEHPPGFGHHGGQRPVETSIPKTSLKSWAMRS